MRAAQRWCGFALATARILLAPDLVAAQSSGSHLDVPYVAQSEALCGGAASAMVLRYWGERGVTAEAFAPLLNTRRDGIATQDLVSGLIQRGWRALAFTGTTASVTHHLARGRPVIALIAIAPGRFHYVVVVEVNGTHVVYHDPAGRPFETKTLAAFEHEWSASSRWTLLVLPAETSTRSTVPPAVSQPILPEACRPALMEAADAAARRQWGQAESSIAAAQIACPSDAAPLRELAGLRLLQGRSGDAVPLARAAVARDSSDRHAWRVLGTAEFLQRNQVAALDAWNHAGEPLNDLVRVDGVARTRHRVVTDRLGLAPGDLLTASALAHARRRVNELPAAGPSRVEVVPVGGGLAEVHVAVLERPLMPTSRIALGALGVRALVSREATWRVASPTGAGERLDLYARWWEARPAVALALSLPVESRIVRGVARLEGSTARESFRSPSAAGPPQVEDHRAAVVSLSDWATANLRWHAAVRVDRWADRQTALGVGGAIEQHAGAHGAVRFQGDVWPAAGFGVASAAVRWRRMRDGAERLLTAATAIAASDAAPRTVWGGAGTGHGRSLLLRAHPLLDDGVIAGEGFGRRLLHASAESRFGVGTMGPLHVQLAAFADAAAASRSDRPASSHVDVGMGLRLRVPGEGTLRLDYARGLSDRNQAVSVGWDLPWPAWP